MISFPNAKINLGLYVTGKRKDGYHNIESIFVPVDLCDILEAVENNRYQNGKNECQITVTGLIPEGNPSDNLCCKAYHLIKKDYDIPPVKIHLHKQIPSGSGLGGGSSDAVSMVKILNNIFRLNLQKDNYEKYASKLGSDCFFFNENRISLIKGRGEVVQPLSLEMKLENIVIIKPSIHISTAWAYSKINLQHQQIFHHKIFTHNPEDWKNFLTNHFEESVFSAYPEIEILKKKLYILGAKYAQMSGSGSAVYGLFDEEIPLPEIDAKNNTFIWKGKLLKEKNN